jgi:hypothetical protein
MGIIESLKSILVLGHAVEVHLLLVVEVMVVSIDHVDVVAVIDS